MLYSDLYKQLLYGVIHEYEFPQEAIEIIIDRFLYGAAQERFDNYLADGLMRSFPKGRSIQGLSPRASFGGGMSLHWLSNPPGSDPRTGLLWPQGPLAASFHGP